jgi:hypothetical protein
MTDTADGGSSPHGMSTATAASTPVISPTPEPTPEVPQELAPMFETLVEELGDANVTEKLRRVDTSRALVSVGVVKNGGVEYGKPVDLAGFAPDFLESCREFYSNQRKIVLKFECPRAGVFKFAVPMPEPEVQVEQPTSSPTAAENAALASKLDALTELVAELRDRHANELRDLQNKVTASPAGDDAEYQRRKREIAEAEHKAYLSYIQQRSTGDEERDAKFIKRFKDLLAGASEIRDIAGAGESGGGELAEFNALANSEAGKMAITGLVDAIKGAKKSDAKADPNGATNGAAKGGRFTNFVKRLKAPTDARNGTNG